MGIFDALKKATGIGLTTQEHYDRAFEKGVLQGPTKFADATELFAKAAERAGQANETSLVVRARANENLYGFISSGDMKKLEALAEILPQLQEIEKIGSKSETMPADALLKEIAARILEEKLEAVALTDHAARVQAHLEIAKLFRAIFNEPLITYKWKSRDSLVETAQSRFFFHQGRAAWEQAGQMAETRPDGAAEFATKALNSFQQSGDVQWIQEITTWRDRYGRKRTCWMCHREFQGEVIHFGVYNTRLTPYILATVKRLNQDVSALDLESGTIVLCSPCGMAVQNVADQYATMRTRELREEMEARLSQIASTISGMLERIKELERRSHSH